MFNVTNGDRPEVLNIAVLITDGAGNRSRSITTEAQALQDTGARVFCLGISSPNLNEAQLNEVASDPDDQHVFIVSDFSELGTVMSAFLTQIISALSGNLGNP